ncbi:MAG: hypothetical protein CVT64_10165 [Actinobacteria bacterium HGW-Actinobacteria-4]|nr:MAG: hypothetical protein CVT64_10165 [Actinobacteria bacterium HGW-Actinobacteria-4]
MRQGLSRYEPGAHLWAPFVVHFRGGVASLLAFVIAYFATVPLEDAMALLTLGAYTIVPAAGALYATVWGFMSVAILHRLRYRDRLRLHFAWYAGVGAVALTLFALATLAVSRGIATGYYDPSTSPLFLAFLAGAPVVGAAGAVFGRWVIDKGIIWHRWIVREPLPDVFTFVEGKHDKDDFKRL